jgi:hypothetical protein
MPFSAHWFLTFDKPGIGAAALAAVEAGKWVVSARDADVSVMPYELASQDGRGNRRQVLSIVA